MAEYCYIDFICEQQRLQRVDERTVAEGASVVCARFELCEKWADLEVFARFANGGAVYDMALDESNAAVVPWEVLKCAGFNVALFGEDSEGARLTSAAAWVDVERSITPQGVEPIPSTTTIIQAFNAKVQRAAEAAEAAQAAAETAIEAAGLPYTTEEWTFTLEDNSTVTKTVVLS